MKKFEKIFFVIPSIGGIVDLSLISIGINTMAIPSILAFSISAFLLQKC